LIWFYLKITSYKKDKMRKSIFIVFFFFSISNTFGNKNKDENYRQKLINYSKNGLIHLVIVKINSNNYENQVIASIPYDHLVSFVIRNQDYSENDLEKEINNIIVKGYKISYQKSDSIFWSPYLINSSFYKKIKSKNKSFIVRKYLDSNFQFKTSIDISQINALILFFFKNRKRVYIDDISGNYTVSP